MSIHETRQPEQTVVHVPPAAPPDPSPEEPSQLQASDGVSLLAWDPIEESLKVFTPAWPLQNTVAVNPFWNMRNEPFWQTLTRLSPGLRQRLLPPLSYFTAKFTDGQITFEALEEALTEAREIWRDLPESATQIVQSSSVEPTPFTKLPTLCEVTRAKIDLQKLVVDEIGKLAGCYFDQNQALVKFPWKHLCFWNAFIESQKVDKTLQIVGLTTFRSDLSEIAPRSPTSAIHFMLDEMGIRSKEAQYLYLQGAATSVIGWGSQFCYHQWQSGLGYEVSASPKPVELLAVRVAYDFLIFRHYKASHHDTYLQWQTELNSPSIGKYTNDLHFGLLYTWQLAMELSYQSTVASTFNRKLGRIPATPDFQMVFCIDVRSEMLRRHIEAKYPDCRTRGFAGFFGAAVDYKKFDEKAAGHRLPVLLSPGTRVEERCTLEQGELAKSLSNTFVASYFRNLRKAPLSSFLFVELFGILSVGNLVRRSIRTLLSHFRHGRLPERFTPSPVPANGIVATGYADKLSLDTNQKAALAANALRHMGLFDLSSGLIVIVGHGANTTNNAFGSSLDCGACGGHAGDLNARFLVSLLNDTDVRAALQTKGFSIPKETWFVAGVHETVTDEVYLLDQADTPAHLQALVSNLTQAVSQASASCRLERQSARSSKLDPSAGRRSTNWSETRPEWGLSGNACFIVAPRETTLGANLSSRAFLHDYDYTQDEGFQTLELIMTAPMVVTNWINMQYFASVVAPGFYGSGNKVLHNLTNEMGVVEGNGGDLRIGLPIQSVHDGEKFVHDPLRLTVFIRAPRAEIEKIIAKHAVVNELIANQWIHLAQIDPKSEGVYRRLSDGSYSEVLIKSGQLKRPAKSL